MNIKKTAAAGAAAALAVLAVSCHRAEVPSGTASRAAPADAQATQSAGSTQAVAAAGTSAAPAAAAKKSETARPVPDGGESTRPEETLRKPLDLGIPLAQRYPRAGEIPRFIPDILSFEGNIYVGGGDDENNRGPVPLYAYSESRKAWIVTAEAIPEEKIKRFQIVGHTLMFGGADPTEDWSLGNFYFLDETGWNKRRTIPAGAHNYDLIGFGGKLFIGIGSTPRADRSVYTILSSQDGGESFQPIDFYKDGKPLDIVNLPLARTYNMVVYQGELYGTLWAASGDRTRSDFELYRYDEGANAFHYAADLRFFTRRMRYNARDFTALFEYGGQVLMINENGLYATADFKSYAEPDVCGLEHVYDMAVQGGRLYVLGASQRDGAYENRVCISMDGRRFQTLFAFSSEIPAYCFTIGEQGFYFGMGSRFFAGHPMLGSVYFIAYDGLPPAAGR